MTAREFIEHEFMPWALAGGLRTWLAAQFLVRYVRAFPR